MMDHEQTRKKLLDSIKYVEFDDNGKVVRATGVGTAKDFKKELHIVKDDGFGKSDLILKKFQESQYSVAPKDFCEVLEIRRID